DLPYYDSVQRYLGDPGPLVPVSDPTHSRSRERDCGGRAAIHGLDRRPAAECAICYWIPSTCPPATVNYGRAILLDSSYSHGGVDRQCECRVCCKRIRILHLHTEAAGACDGRGARDDY